MKGLVLRLMVDCAFPEGDQPLGAGCYSIYLLAVGEADQIERAAIVACYDKLIKGGLSPDYLARCSFTVDEVSIFSEAEAVWTAADGLIFYDKR